MSLQIQSLEAYKEAYQKSVENPSLFWDEIANQFLWRKKWTKTLEYDWTVPETKWFLGGQMNITENALDRHLETRGDQLALICEPNSPEEETKYITYKELHSKVCAFANVLKRNGAKKGDRICIYMPMILELSVAILACARIGAIHSVVFAGFSSTALAARINDATCSILLTADGGFRGDKITPLKDIADEALKNAPSIKKSIICQRTYQNITWNPSIDVWWHEELEKVDDNCPAETMDSEDMLFILYTSGSTGNPKAVAHTLQQHLCSAQGLLDVFNFEQADTWLLSLPMYHVSGLAIVHRWLAAGGCIKIGTGQLETDIEECSHASLVATQLHRLLKSKQALTLTHVLLGGSHIPEALGLEAQQMGIETWLGYGMTETTATVSCWDDRCFNPDSIGMSMPGAEVKIGAKDEILVRGPMVMRGYYKMPEETAKTFDEHGFLKTGDAGHFDENGNLFITDRIKELMKTSGGKYIAPQVVEGAIGKDHFIEQIAVIADTRKFVSALIVPCYDSLEEYAKELNIKYHDRVELVKHHQIVEMLEKRVNDLQQELAKFEQVKKFKLLPKAFSMDDGELTPTQKLRRKVINDKYQDEIEEMYNEKPKDK